MAKTLELILNKLLFLINIFIPKVALRVSVKRKTRFYTNVFQTNYQKRALISFLTSSFQRNPKITHTNQLECLNIALACKELGYDVDVIDYDHHHTPYNIQYDLVIGFGDVMEQLLSQKNIKCIHIMYSPGCNTVFSNKMSAIKLNTFYEKNGLGRASLGRFANEAWPLQKYCVDAIVVQGNEFVKSTYQLDFEDTKYYSIDCFPLQRKNNVKLTQDVAKYRNHMIWFGSAGSVHKGLDVALALLYEFPDLKLSICGYNKKNEPELYQAYKNLFESNRVTYYDFLDINSSDFESLLNTHCIAIFPSVSEGGAAGLLTLMAHGGLIPITTQTTGLDIENLGFVSKGTDYESIKNSYVAYTNLSDEDIKNRMKTIKMEISERYQINKHQERLKEIIAEVSRLNNAIV